MKIAVILENGQIQAIYSGDPAHTEVAVYDLDAIRAGQAPLPYEFVVRPLRGAGLEALPDDRPGTGDRPGPPRRDTYAGAPNTGAGGRPRVPWSTRALHASASGGRAGLPGRDTQSHPGASSAKPPTVVVVEDDPALRRLYKEMLTLMNCRPVVFSHGQKCLDYLVGKYPSMLIVDVLLPDIDGIELIERAVPMLAPGTPVICLTNIEAPEMEAFIREVGAHDVIQKTLDLRTIQARLEDWLSPYRPS